MKKIFFLLIATLQLFHTQAQLTEYEQTTAPATPNRLIKGDERLEQYLPLLENKRIGVVCNHTSMVNGTHLVDTLLSCNVNVKTIFSPEHGFKGSQEAGRLINGVNYYKDSVKIISLYGKNKKPTEEQMNELDVIVFDLQDVGCRFYTYISTLEYVMQACIQANKRLIVTDRPNPNNFVAGPVLKNDCKSFVGMQNIPICYGLTIGEYARMINDEHLVDSLRRCDLSVIGMQNYVRDSIYALDVFPSPNLQSMRAVRNYPTLCLFEGTPISVGRGTSSPFEIIGFPEYSAENEHKNTDTLSFTPKSLKGIAENPPFKNVLCNGIMINIDTNEIMIEYVIDMYEAYPQKKGFFNRMFDLLIGNKDTKTQIEKGKCAEEIRKLWEKDLNNYKEIRKKYLIY